MVSKKKGKMKSLILLLLLGFLLSYTYAYAACPADNYESCGTNCYKACDCSYAKVSTTITAAPAKSTIIVPPGSCTWSSQLVITKGITLQGAGSGNTLITGDYDWVNSTARDTANYLVVYNPTNPEDRDAFRLTGFSFDLNHRSYGIILFNDSAQTAATIPNQIRVDHNIVKNGDGSGSVHPKTIYVVGMWGVIDNNTFNTCDLVFETSGSSTEGSWNNLDPYSYGSANNMYFEDNTVINLQDGAHDSGGGGTYVARYNDYSFLRSDAGIAPWIMVHGNQPSGVYSAIGLEAYGNYLNMPNKTGGQLFNQRGGKGLIFYNSSNSSGSVAMAREEWADGMSPTTNSQPQHVSDSYYWNNRQSESLVTFMSDINYCAVGTGDWVEDNAFSKMVAIIPTTNNSNGYCFQVANAGTSGSVGDQPNWNSKAVASEFADNTVKWINGSAPTPITENIDYFNHNVSFNGTSGVGCGTLASRPATCTAGVGYWATNQSCSSVDDVNVGANPITPISGTLYKCTSTNKWTAYYTPYSYPHPLRNTPNPPMNVR